MTDLIISEKDRLTEKLSEQYARNVITLDEYEKTLDVVNKIETSRDIVVAERMIAAYSDMVTPHAPPRQPPPPAKVSKNAGKKEFVSIFSTRDVTVTPVNGKAGTFSTIFGTMRVKVSDLPAGTTKLKVEALFGTIEILVPRNARVTSNVDSIFGSAFLPDDEPYDDAYDDYRLELHIKGEAIFGTVTVKRID